MTIRGSGDDTVKPSGAAARPDAATFRGELLALGRRLHAEGKDSLTVSLELGRRNAQHGWLLPEVASIAREATGGSGPGPWEVLRRLPRASCRSPEGEPQPDTGPDFPTSKEVGRRRRGARLAGLVRLYAPELAPAVWGLVEDAVAERVREVLADDLPAALAVLGRAGA